MNRKTLFCSVFFVATAILSLIPGSKCFSQEAQLYVITKWDGGCGGSTCDEWDDMGDAWYNEMAKHSGWYKDRRECNGSIVDSKFCDKSKVSWGKDYNYIDEGDAVMICLHGGESSDRWVGKMRVDEAGTGDCFANQKDMSFGETDIEFLHLSSCNSLNQNQWFFNWKESMNGLHQLDGFHGYMWISTSLAPRYSEFAKDAFSISLSASWIDNMYYPDISGSDDQCPVAYVEGYSEADCAARLTNERYNNQYSAPGSSALWAMTTYILGCDPTGKEPMK